MNLKKLKSKHLVPSRFFNFFEVAKEFSSQTALHLVRKLHSTNPSFSFQSVFFSHENHNYYFNSNILKDD